MGVVLYMSLSGEQTDITPLEKAEVSQPDAPLQESVVEEVQLVSDEKEMLPPPPQSDPETLRQEAEQRFEKLTRIEAASGKSVERGEGLRIQIENPTPSESEQTE